MIYYGIFCLATSIVTLARIQVPAAQLAFRQESVVFWITLFLANMVMAPALFFLTIFTPHRFMKTTHRTFLDRHYK